MTPAHTLGRRLTDHFLRGALVITPVLGSLFTVWTALTTLDAWVGGVLADQVPGFGLLLAFVTVMTVGMATEHVFGRRLWGWLDEVLDRVPVFRLLYSTFRDFTSALVGEKKSFDRPCVVMVGEGLRVLGFLTADDLGHLGLPGQVTVYLPQTYNFAGNLLVVDRARVEVLDQPGPEFLTFILSGGVARG